MSPRSVPVASKDIAQKNKTKGEKAPIREVLNPVCLEERLYDRVHVHKDKHLKG